MLGKKWKLRTLVLMMLMVLIVLLVLMVLMVLMVRMVLISWVISWACHHEFGVGPRTRRTQDFVLQASGLHAPSPSVILVDGLL